MLVRKRGLSLKLCYQSLQSPLGQIYIATDEASLRILAIGSHWHQLKKSLVKTGFEGLLETAHPILSQTKQQLDEYFAGRRLCFDLPFYCAGTAFQQAAWKALLDIPYGETRSYAQQAQAIHNPKAVRAIGHANGQNPISIIVPCHRVIGKSGKLTGYASGLAHKKYLIDFEKRVFKRPDRVD